MNVVIMAAGLGSRLGTLTADRPKALVEIAGKPLLQYMLQLLDHEAINKIAVVGGYEFDRLKSWLAENAPQVECIDNPNFRDGSVRTLQCAAHLFTEDVLVTNVDHIYHPDFIERLVAPRTEITAMCDFDRSLEGDDMKVALNEDKHITAIHKQLDQFDAGYIGMTYVPRNHHDQYWTASENTLVEKGPSSVVEWTLGHLAAQHYPVGICDCSGLGWAEVDCPEEIPAAEKFVAQHW